jgi:glycosyltransferase involved in cell wall biosynthesis
MYDWLKKSIKMYDIIHIHGIFSIIPFIGCLLAKKNSIPYILRPAGSLDRFDIRKKYIIKQTLARPFVYYMLKYTSALHCTSPLEAANVDTFGAKINPDVLPIPVEVSEQKGDREKFRKNHFLSSEDFVLLFMSRIDYKKGLNILIPAFAALQKRFRNMKLVIAGSGTREYETKTRSWIKQYELADNIRWCGFLSGSEKLDALVGCDIFVLPSMNENFGVAILEALGAGLPVVISDNVYLWKEVVELGGGWVAKKDIISLENTIAGIICNPSELNQKKHFTQIIAKRFAPGTLMPEYQRFYERILGFHK